MRMRSRVAVTCCCLGWLSIVATAAPADAFKLSDTAQVLCYDPVSFEPIPCDGTGQDGAYLRNPMDTEFDEAHWWMVDKNTELVWPNVPAPFLGTWEAAKAQCAGLEHGGASDWRLPSRKELVSIDDFLNVAPETAAWTSSPDVAHPGGAWYVDFATGAVMLEANPNQSFYAVCVRGPQNDTAIFSDNGDGTVTDARTGLDWQRYEAGPTTWAAALEQCENLTLGGTDNWRLPNVKELESLVDETRSGPAIDNRAFPWTSFSGTWSSTTEAAAPANAWVVSFGYGTVVPYGKLNADAAVRCVRNRLVTFSVGSTAALDGWVLERSETAEKGATFSATDMLIRIGDDALDRQYRGILSFNTAALPDGAQIVSATLKAKRRRIAGTSPFATHGPLVVDFAQGAFSGAGVLGASDFQAPATRPSALSLPPTPGSPWHSGALPAEALAVINATGMTQARLRFEVGDDDDATADYVEFFSGGAAASSRPRLEIRYVQP